MTLAVRTLEGLPPYGPEATVFPAEWRRSGREGVVVEFESEAGTWVGNFRPGLGGLCLVALHPNRRDAVVIADGSLWIVDPIRRSATVLSHAVFAALEVRDPDGWVLSRQDLALFRLGPRGVLWHTRRLSWDGFDELRVGVGEVTGLGCSLDGRWHPFRVDVATGRSSGGGYDVEDFDRWERLAE